MRKCFTLPSATGADVRAGGGTSPSCPTKSKERRCSGSDRPKPVKREREKESERERAREDAELKQGHVVQVRRWFVDCGCKLLLGVGVCAMQVSISEPFRAMRLTFLLGLLTSEHDAPKRY